jgi:hypothetical protein
MPQTQSRHLSQLSTMIWIKSASISSLLPTHYRRSITPCRNDMTNHTFPLQSCVSVSFSNICVDTLARLIIIGNCSFFLHARGKRTRQTRSSLFQLEHLHGVTRERWNGNRLRGRSDELKTRVASFWLIYLFQRDETRTGWCKGQQTSKEAHVALINVTTTPCL